MDPFGHDEVGVIEKHILAISQGCPNHNYVLYLCRKMKNEKIIAVAQNCPRLTQFSFVSLIDDGHIT